MRQDRIVNRWAFVGAAVVIQITLGNLYSWSIFRNPLMDLHDWTMAQATVPFTLSTAFFALGTILAGRWQDRVGPRVVAMTGGVLLGVGFVLAGLLGQTLPALYVTYGMIGGLGVGFAYITSIAVCVKWFPDRRGAISGIAVLGFGLAPLIGAPVGTALIDRIGVHPTFALGAGFGLLVVAAGSVLRDPPAGWRPAGWTPPQAQAGGVREYGSREMTRTPQFKLLWVIYLFWAGVGLMAISQAAPMGEELAGLSPEVAAGALGIMAVFNGLGRPAFGWISDRIGRRAASVLAQLVYLVALVLVLPRADEYATYTLGISLIGFSYGGALSLMPAFTADHFGTRNLGANYGWVFSAWGFAGVLGPILGVQVRQATGTWTDAFGILAALSLVAGVLALLVRPRARQAPEERAAVAPPRAA